ncbi:MAG TPA: DUF3995 domain-containing protein [Myxococcales bacterium]|nr:DUF3995 domain-containing protein [Myxococcales bacterium]
MLAVATLQAAVLFLLSSLHVYWALGGRRGLAVAVPQREPGGPPAFIPGAPITFAVAAGLALGGVVALGLGRCLQPQYVPDSWLRVLGAAGAVAFGARALGDFRLVGFFKKVRGTPFARWDSALYSPLCALLAAGWLALSLRSYR